MIDFAIELRTVFANPIKVVHTVRADFDPNIEMLRMEKDGKICFVPLGAEEGAYITPLRGMHIGVVAKTCYTGDLTFVGNPAWAWGTSGPFDGKVHGMVLPRYIEEITKILKREHGYIAERLISDAKSDPEKVFVPEGLCDALGITEGERVRLSRDPVTKPTRELLMANKETILRELLRLQTQPQATPADIYRQ